MAPQRKSIRLVVGTEEGAIHLCSVNMADSYVETFFGHAGPVYHVACIWRLHQVGYGAACQYRSPHSILRGTHARPSLRARNLM